MCFSARFRSRGGGTSGPPQLSVGSSSSTSTISSAAMVSSASRRTSASPPPPAQLRLLRRAAPALEGLPESRCAARDGRVHGGQRRVTSRIVRCDLPQQVEPQGRAGQAVPPSAAAVASTLSPTCSAGATPANLSARDSATSTSVPANLPASSARRCRPAAPWSSTTEDKRRQARPVIADGGEDICGHGQRLAGGLTLRMSDRSVRPGGRAPAREGEPIGHNGRGVPRAPDRTGGRPAALEAPGRPVLLTAGACRP